MSCWYRVYLDASEAELVGLYRRRFVRAGKRIGSEAYHPRSGWILNDYWLRIGRGESERHLVEVAEDEAWETVAHFDRMSADGDPED